MLNNIWLINIATRKLKYRWCRDQNIFLCSYKLLGMSRGKKDFIILKDEGILDEQSSIIDEMLHSLKKSSLTGSILNKRELPGVNKNRTISLAISDADFVICMFDKSSDISPSYIDKLRMCHNMKLRQGIDGHIIPVFIDMTPEETDLIINHHPRLSFLDLYGAAYTQHDDWYERLIQSITTPPLGKKHLYHYLQTMRSND